MVVRTASESEKGSRHPETSNKECSADTETDGSRTVLEKEREISNCSKESDGAKLEGFLWEAGEGGLVGGHI